MAVLLMSAAAGAQTQSKEEPQLTQLRTMNAPEQVRTFFLHQVPERMDAEEILSDIRILLPHATAYYVPSQGAISVKANAEEMALVEQLITALDQRRKVYKITYAIAEMESAKPAPIRHIQMILPVGGAIRIKQGTRVPIVTGSASQDTQKSSSQVQYIDIGINVEGSLEGNGDSVWLKTSIEESSMSDEKSAVGPPDPVIQQTKFEGNAMLTPGKSTMLGSLDLPGSGRHEEISVMSELVK